MTRAVSTSSRENVLDGILNQKSRLEQHTRQTTRPVIIRVAAAKTTSPVTQQRSARSDFGSQEPEIVCPVGQAVLLSHRRDPSPARLSDRSSVDSYRSFTALVFNCPFLERFYSELALRLTSSVNGDVNAVTAIQEKSKRRGVGALWEGPVEVCRERRGETPDIVPNRPRVGERGWGRGWRKDGRRGRVDVWRIRQEGE
ncbi:hypothetical protein C0Q70_12818 [Pomacea canaliculata]|uniref:Uncharacterized protein n=1 Tax=Pomacea canaliculata TaxID=400727 RepID=A0A2T7P2K9_POMCA|nr:hypothetical protein C0Q70_12818 [Pomacea canaliculata]